MQIENNTVSSSRSGIFLEGVGGTIQTNTISSNTKYGVLLQQSSVVLGSNSFAANGQNSLTTSSLIEAFGALPTPIP
ncbi:MAG: right-handed parallel beta-helix repeat-containing protein [Deltaproteobacteria bacterium]|nr:right-handed parallel beta-helix repeat-containing protein [Deltaproteobacteria bacterium]